MSEKLAARLDLEHAWKLAKADIRGDRKGRNFVSHPFEVELLDMYLSVGD